MNNKHMMISISGEPLTGKSTTMNLLIEQFTKEGYEVEILYTGGIFRQFAKELNIPVSEFGDYIKIHPEIDKKIDKEIEVVYEKIMKSEVDNKKIYFFDSRLAYHFAPTSFSIRLVADENEVGRRAYNCSERENEIYDSVEDAIEKVKKRRESEVARYKNLYKTEITDLNNYHIVVDTTNIKPEDVAKTLMEAYNLHRDEISYKQKGDYLNF